MEQNKMIHPTDYVVMYKEDFYTIIPRDLRGSSEETIIFLQNRFPKTFITEVHVFNNDVSDNLPNIYTDEISKLDSNVFCYYYDDSEKQLNYGNREKVV